MTKRLLLLLAVCFLVLPADGQRRRAARSPAPAPADPLGAGPLANLPPAQLEEFHIGRAEFIERRTVGKFGWKAQIATLQDRDRFLALPPAERTQLLVFLKSL
ncbi:MAG TPA: hypothetical protein VEO54_18530 [Thermoanaerobaculia bacterium]|nr:hypothetical protein [Thermoanaerobaculia bacterium]